MTKTELPASQRVVLAIDASEVEQAEKLAKLAKQAGARFIKLGLELSTATSWAWCASLAEKYELDWICDAKLDDIPNTVAGAVKNLRALPKAPYGITLHVTVGQEAMAKAQDQADQVIIFGVTVLTSIASAEAQILYHASLESKVMELASDAANAGLGGLVCSAQEVGAVKKDPSAKNLITLVPGTRSKDAAKGDQSRVTTPAEAIKNGADLLVIGRQITQSPNPEIEYQKVVAEIESAL